MFLTQIIHNTALTDFRPSLICPSNLHFMPCPISVSMSIMLPYVIWNFKQKSLIMKKITHLSMSFCIKMKFSSKRIEYFLIERTNQHWINLNMFNLFGYFVQTSNKTSERSKKIDSVVHLLRLILWLILVYNRILKKWFLKGWHLRTNYILLKAVKTKCCFLHT